MMSDPAPIAAIDSRGVLPMPFPMGHAGDVHAVPGDGGAMGQTPGGEACPPPLVWQEVLAAYRSDSEPWELDVGPRRLIGRTWGSGPSLYLLNGFVATAELYSLMIWLLRDSFRCVVFDTVCGSGRARHSPTIHDFASDLFAAADRNDDSSFAVFGPSFGAAVALQGALDQPDRINHLALQHGFARRQLSFFERQLAYWCSWSGRSLSALPGRRRVQELNHRRWFPPFDGTRFEFLVESTGRIPLADLSKNAMALRSFAIEDRLKEIRCPIMLVRTEGEGRLEAESYGVLEQNLPGARTEWLHSSGLHPYLTHPHRVAKLLKTFFLPSEATT